MTNSSDIDFMKRCLALAEKAMGNTHPNPMVGAIIVYENKIIGEGWHQKAGEPHAEVNAINEVSDKTLLTESTLYINLEPCCHFGKTPPCADLIVQFGIKKVVIASTDPNPQVAGKGILKLKEAGVEVIEAVLKKEAEFLNRRFYTFHQKKRPYIIMKWAQTEDGFISPLINKTNRPVWISNNLSKQKVHQWRSQEASILVGAQTVITDNPILNTREWPGNNPLRIILDPSNRIPEDVTLLKDELRTIILCKNKKERHLKENKEYHILNPFNLDSLIEFCYKKNILSLFVEGGQKTLNYFIKQELWDEARIFTSKQKFKKGIKSPEFYAPFFSEEELGDNTLKIYFK